MTRPDFMVVAVRYCADVPALATFFETVGLSRRISTTDDGFISLVAGDGLLMLHAAGTAETGVPAGGTELALEVTELDATFDTLVDLGLDPVRWDESYGRQLGIRDPRGDGIWISEAQRDLYGFREYPAEPNDLNLLPVRFSDDFATDVAFYTALGFHPRADASEHFTPLAGVSPTQGVLGLHPPDGVPRTGPHSPDNPVSPPVLVDLVLETHEELAAVAARLSDFSAQVIDGPAPRVQVIDPEGVEIQIHLAP